MRAVSPGVAPEVRGVDTDMFLCASCATRRPYSSLTAVFNASASCKSLLTGMALIRGVIDVDQAMAAARVEEDMQIEEWGLVEGGHDIDLADIRVRLLGPRVMINLLRRV